MSQFVSHSKCVRWTSLFESTFYALQAESHWRNDRQQNELPTCPTYYGLIHVFGIDETACRKTLFRIRKFPSNAVPPFSQKLRVALPFNTALHRLSRLSAVSHAKVWLKNNQKLWRPLHAHTWICSNITKIKESVDTLSQIIIINIIIIILHYNPLWVFAFSAKSLQVLLSLAVSFQFLTFSFFRSSMTSSRHRCFGLPIGLVPIGFQSNSFLGGLAWSILWICPSHLILCALMNLTTSAPSIKLSSSMLFRILHTLPILTL